MQVNARISRVTAQNTITHSIITSESYEFTRRSLSSLISVEVVKYFRFYCRESHFFKVGETFKGHLTIESRFRIPLSFPASLNHP